MRSRDPSRWRRRTFLRGLGVSFAAAFGIQPVSATHNSVAVTVEDQKSDGESLVISSARFDVDVRLAIRFENHPRTTQNISSGTNFSNRTVTFDEPISESQVIPLYVYERETGRLLDWDIALVSVEEPIDDISITDVLDEEYELIQADSGAGYHYPYYLYTPNLIEDSTQPIIVQGNNSPLPKDDPRNHVLFAKRMIEGLVDRFAADFQIPALVPAFPRLRQDPPPRTQSHLYVQALNDQALRTDHPSLKRVDQQLISMVDDAQNRLTSAGYSVTDQMHLHGFSTSGRFAPRIAMLHPERVSAVSAGGNGIYTLPTAEFDGQRIPYPVGVADFERLVGHEFNLGDWKEIPMYFYLGEDDSSDPLSSLREELGELVTEIYPSNVTGRFQAVESVFDTVGASASFEIYEGVGHRTSQQQVEDLRTFHWEHIDAEHTQQGSLPISDITLGIGGALVGVAGGGYMLKRRLNTSSDE